MTHRDDRVLIKNALDNGIFEVVYREIEKRGLNRREIPAHVHQKLHRCVINNSSVALSLALQQAISEMIRIGVMKDFP